MENSKEKIVFLDSGTLDYGDISFAELGMLGDFKAYNKTALFDIESRVQDADMIITNKCLFDAQLIAKLKTVRAIHLAATGVNNVDLEAAREKRIAVTNVSGYSTESVVQATFAFILALAGNLPKYHQAAHDGRWTQSPFFTLGTFPILEIHRKTLGIVGYGTIGQRVARIAKAFGMKVLIGSIPGRDYSKAESVDRVSFDYLLKHSDFVTIHTALTDLTRQLLNAEALLKMKHGAFLINMARGGIVDEKALRQVLESGHLAGAALDVLTQEPPPCDHILLNAPNLLLTPHVAWASQEARKRLVHEISLNIRAFQQGRSRNRVV